MKNASVAVSYVIAMAALTACGGGGDGADAHPSEATRISGMAAARDDVTTTVLSPTGATKKSPAPVPHPGMVLDPLVVNRVLAELDRIEQALRRIDPQGEVEILEALEVVSEVRAELQKERPNRLRLRSLLSGLGEGLQVVEGLKSAGVLLSRLVTMV